MQPLCCRCCIKRTWETFKVYLSVIRSGLSKIWVLCGSGQGCLCACICQIYDVGPAIRDLCFCDVVLFWEVSKARALIMASCLLFDVCGPMTETTWRSLQRRPQKGDNSHTDYVLPCMRVIWDDHNSKLQGWNVGGKSLVSNKGYSKGLTSSSEIVKGTVKGKKNNFLSLFTYHVVHNQHEFHSSMDHRR